MSYHDACPSVLHSGQRAVGGSAYSPTIITGSIGRTGGAGPAAGVPSILQHQPVAPPGGADAEHLMRSNQGGFWWFWWSVVCNARDSDTCPIPPRRWRESGSSVTSRSGDVWPAFTTVRRRRRYVGIGRLYNKPADRLRIRPQDVPAPATSSLPSGMPRH